MVVSLRCSWLAAILHSPRLGSAKKEGMLR
jgi:hypothetical protein